MTSAAGVLLRRTGGGVSTAYLLGTGSVLPAADGAWALRKVNRDYTGNCVKVRRSSDNTTSDIGFNGLDLDQVALLAWCGAGDGFVERMYDQSQAADLTFNGHDLIQLNAANQYRIVHNGVVETKNGEAVLRAPDQYRGWRTDPFTAYAGTVVSAFFVGVLPAASSDSPPRVLSLLPATAGQADHNSAGAALIARQDSANIGKTEGLVDLFTSQDTAKWSGFTANAAVASGQLAVIPTSPYQSITSVAKYDLTESHVIIEIPQRANQGNGTIETQIQVKTDTNNIMSFVISGTNLTMRERAAGANNDLALPYNASTQRWLRLRESAGTLFWDTSPDGTTWTNGRAKSRAMTTPTSVNIVLTAGYYGTETTVGTALYDNLNTTGTATPTTNWTIERGGPYLVTKAASTPAGTMDQVTAIINGALATLSVNGAAATGALTSTAFNFTAYGVGHDGIHPQSATDEYFAELVVFNKSVTGSQATTVQSNQQAYWATPSQGAGGQFSAYTLVAEETFDDNVFRTSDFVQYNNGVATSHAGAWMSSENTVANQRLRIAVRRTSTPVTIGGTNYYRRGGALYWTGPDDGNLGVAFKKGGLWECRFRMDACAGFGFAILLWPHEGPSFPGDAPWPVNGEIDIMELYSGNTSKFGGESNWHLDSVGGSGRHLKAPGTTTHSPAGMVSAGNFQTDWTTFHNLKCVWIPSQRIETYLDDVLVGYTTDLSYVPDGTNNGYDVPFRVTFQSEFYNTSDAAADFNTHYAEIDYMRYYALS